MPKNIFKKYDSYAYSFLTDYKEKIEDITKYIVLYNRFEIATLTTIKELLDSNKLFYELIEERKEQEQNG